MTDNNVIKLAQPGTFIDSLTEILRSGARALLTQAVEAEVADFLHRHCDLKTDAGHQRVVRHGHLPEREIMTGIGPVGVRQPRIRDREAAAGERIRFNQTILPPYARRQPSLVSVYSAMSAFYNGNQLPLFGMRLHHSAPADAPQGENQEGENQEAGYLISLSARPSRLDPGRARPGKSARNRRPAWKPSLHW